MRLPAVLAAAVLLSGCEISYYTQLLRGQYDLLARRAPMAELVAAPDTPAALREKLTRAMAARRFASAHLALPDNGSYTQYADLGRPFALWNVFATPELSLQPHEWCYLFLGCLAYRGYYAQADADAAAASLGAQGLDAYVGGVPAYSTLGWFDDPLLNTIGDDEAVVAGTIFHELAHQVEFRKGDTAFNESFATFVEQEGLREYLQDRPELVAQAEQRRALQAEFIELILASRERLEGIYAGTGSDAAKRAAKAAEFARLRAEYGRLAARWGRDYYGAFMSGELNNARLLPFGLYYRRVPEFQALFDKCGRDWRAFYAAVKDLR